MFYRNFDIAIDDPTPEGYPVRAVSPVFGEARGMLDLDPADQAFLDLQQRLEEGGTDMETLTRFGTELYNALFSGEIETIFQQSYGYSKGTEDTGLRLRLKIFPPEISAIPWEAVYFPAEKCFMGTSMNCPLVRYLELARPVELLEVHLPLRILAVIPADTPPYPGLDSAEERKYLRQAVADVEKKVEITWLDGNVTLENVRDALTGTPYHCFHFIGHGEFAEDRGTLLFNTVNGDTDYVDEERFASLFQNHPSMRMIMLNSCHGASTSPTRRLSGLAPGLVQRGIPAVVAMKYGIDDRAAIVFAREFYRKLFKGWDTGRVDVAMAHARNRLAAEADNAKDYCAPVLYLRAPEGVLFDPVRERTGGDIPWTKGDLQRKKAVYDTYRASNELTGTEQYSDELQRLAHVIKLRRYGQIGAVAIACLLFLLSWVGAFDLLNLDTWAEMYTMRMGEKLADTGLDDDIVLVTTAKAIDTSWRGDQHPRLVTKLSQAGAAVIAFDITFPGPTENDARFAEAITGARRRGTEIIIGVKDLHQNRPVISTTIGEAVSPPLGITCMGRKLNFTRSVPLAVISGHNGAEETYLALSLVAYASLKGLNAINPLVDPPNRQLSFPGVTGPPTSLGFAEIIRARQKHGCPIIQSGDTICDMIIAPIPLDMLRDPRHRLSYETVFNLGISDLRPRVQDKLILVGGEHDDTFSEGRGPLRETRFGVEYHAEAVNTLLGGIFIRPLGTSWQIGVMLLLGLTGSWLRIALGRAPGWKKGCVGVTLLLAVVGCALLLYSAFHLLLNILYPLGSLALAYLATGKIDKRIST